MTPAPPRREPPRAELHHPVPLARIRGAGLTVRVTANPAECAALAARMGIPAVLALSCDFALTAAAGVTVAGPIPGPFLGTVLARGRLVARVVRTCVASLDAFEAAIDETFHLRFVPADSESGELDPEEPEDEVAYRGTTLDLGEAAAEQLALALDPYPRRPGAARLPALDPPNGTSPGGASPNGAAPGGAAPRFAGLADLRRRH